MKYPQVGWIAAAELNASCSIIELIARWDLWQSRSSAAGLSFSSGLSSTNRGKI